MRTILELIDPNPAIHLALKLVTFQQDNAGPHVARVLRHYLIQQNVDVLP
jgi:hypothetical protein